MNDKQKQYTHATALLALMVACGACAGSPPLPEEPTPAHDLPEVQMDDEIFNVSNSTKDETNRYATAVLVAISGAPECSGVLIHRRLALTAGHCVCRGREDKTSITLDSSDCEKTAKIIAISYSGPGQRPYLKTYTGSVRAHRDFRAVLLKKKLLVPPGAVPGSLTNEAGAQYVTVNTVSESQADLALIAGLIHCLGLKRHKTE